MVLVHNIIIISINDKIPAPINVAPDTLKYSANIPDNKPPIGNNPDIAQVNPDTLPRNLSSDRLCAVAWVIVLITIKAPPIIINHSIAIPIEEL